MQFSFLSDFSLKKITDAPLSSRRARYVANIRFPDAKEISPVIDILYFYIK